MPTTTRQRREYLRDLADAAGTRRAQEIIERAFIAPERWGRDHLSTLLYLETRCVDHAGYVRLENLRGLDPKYPTRLANDEVMEMHSDFDCIMDMIAFGFVEYAEPGDNAPPSSGGDRYRLTDKGWQKAHELRRARAERALER